MNLQTILPQSLWEAIRNNYEKRDHTSAILDCCYFISELLRQRSGSDGDGVPLVGQALGGTNPKIRIAKDQSETEQNIQKGMESILRGFYQAIRNPRSHNKIVDSADDSLSIILFCGYLVKQLEQARATTSKEEFILRALDKDFVPNSHYAELLLSEIPNRLRLQVFYGVYERIADWNVYSIRYFNSAIIKAVSDEDRAAITTLVSDDLKTSENDATIRHILGGIATELWSDIAEISRYRIEHKLIRSIRDGKYETKHSRLLSGGLATWAKPLFSQFLLKSELISAIATKLDALDSRERDYGLHYLLSSALSSFELSDLGPIHRVLTRKLKQGIEAFYNDLVWESTKTWSPEMQAAFDSFSAKSDGAIDDEIPF